MTVLIYSIKTKGAGERILQVIETVVSEGNVDIYRSIDALSRGLRQPRNDMTIALLLASSKEDLLNLLSIRDLLWDMKIILVLPNSDPDTVAKGHMLKPRFLSYCDSDFVDVAAVLSLMIRNLGADKNLDLHT
jgi:hypothetical protein